MRGRPLHHRVPLRGRDGGGAGGAHAPPARAAEGYFKLAQKLFILTKAQTLLSSEEREAIALAARIAPTSQGRLRQEKLIKAG